MDIIGIGLLAFRVIQGLGGGALLLVAQAIISESFPPEGQGQAMGLFGWSSCSAPLSGRSWGAGSRTPTTGPGSSLSALGLATLETVLEQGERAAWFQSAFITVTAAIAVLALLGFVLWELHTPAPAADLRIFKNLSFSSATFIGGVFFAGLFGSLILLPQFLQGLLNYTATQAA